VAQYHEKRVLQVSGGAFVKTKNESAIRSRGSVTQASADRNDDDESAILWITAMPIQQQRKAINPILLLI